MTRALGRFAFVLLLHLTMVASGYACANPAMAMRHEGSTQHHHAPTAPERCLAPASCAPAMQLADEILIEPIVAEQAALPVCDVIPAVLDPAAPDTPPPRA